jgi:bifunctional non-homologous end joining protein LigD
MAGEEVHVAVDGRTLRLSNLDKVLYPQTGTTKGEVLNYYAQIAPVLLPHMADRAVTRIRWPHGTGDLSFFEKNLPNGTPSWIRGVSFEPGGRLGTRGRGEAVTYPIVDGLAALTYLVNLASLELHVHQWTVDADGSPRNPNRLVIDLDPGPPAGLFQCCRVALLVRDKLAALGLASAPVTSGSKGLHMYAALDGSRTADEVRDLAQEVAQELTGEHGDLMLWKMTKSMRGGKVFLDWSQNTAAKTTITPYSLRGKDRPFVAAPRTWAEVEAGAEDEFAIDQLLFGEVLDRAASDGDIFGELLAG